MCFNKKIFETVKCAMKCVLRLYTLDKIHQILYNINLRKNLFLFVEMSKNLENLIRNKDKRQYMNV